MKTLEFLKKEAIPYDPSADPFYSWTASLITVNRRKTLVVTHDASRCGFVLYGVTADVRKVLDHWIREGIRQTLACENIDPGLISRYLSDLGEEPIYTKTGDRSVVGRMNLLISDLQAMPLLWVEGEVLQPAVMKTINRLLFSVRGKPQNVRNLLTEGFCAHYHTDVPRRADMAVVNIRLTGTDCLRQVRVPVSCPLALFHQLIGRVMCWNDRQMHIFMVSSEAPLSKQFGVDKVETESDAYRTLTPSFEWKTTLGDAFRISDRFYYIYDFGDEWLHQITLVRTEPGSPDADCRCILASGDAPPEDIGGPEQFRDFEALMARPGEPGYEQVRNWAGSQLWEPLNVERINRALLNL